MCTVFQDATQAHNFFLGGAEDPVAEEWNRLAFINTEAMKILAKERGIN